MVPRVSIIIPTWNGKTLLPACLDSTEAQTCRAFEVVVVDDGSTDDTEDFVRKAHPRVRLLRRQDNRGFCVAVNTGIRETTTDFVLLLNNDMVLDPGFVERLLAAADNSDTAMFAPLVLFQDAPDTVYGAGDRQRVNGRPESIGFREARANFVAPATIFGVSAGAALYRRSVFKTVGLFDERFEAYFEDSDLNFRARLAGFKAAFVPDAIAYHKGAASIEGRTWWRARQCYRNHALLVAKNVPLSLLIRYAPHVLRERVHQARSLVSAARTQFGLVRALILLATAWAGMVRALPHALRRRWAIQRTRVLTAADVEALLTGEGE